MFHYISIHITFIHELSIKIENLFAVHSIWGILLIFHSLLDEIHKCFIIRFDGIRCN